MKEFGSLSHFVVHLTTLPAKAMLAAHHGLKEAAKHVEAVAKSEFGVYQPAVGAFPEWAPLAEATVADRVRLGYTPDDPLLRSGELRDSIKHEVSGMEAMIGSEEQVMLWQEVGTSHMPPRPVLGPAGVRSEHAVGAILGHAVGRAIAGLPSMKYGSEGAMVELEKLAQ